MQFLCGSFSHLLNGGESRDKTIEISNGFIYFLNGGMQAGKLRLDVKRLVNSVDTIAFPSRWEDNPFTSTDVRYSPLEADKNSGVWKNQYARIDFPKFMPLFMTYLLRTGNIPTAVDLAKIYLGVYMEVVPSCEEIKNRADFYNNPYADDRLNVGNTLYYVDGTPILNCVVRFKKQYANTSYPFNEFTVEQVCSRILKSYASLIRDAITPLKFFYLSYSGANVVYNLYDDIKNGIDLTYNNTFILASTCTPNAQKFDSIKMEDVKARHNFLRVGDSALRMKMEVLNKDGIALPCSDDLERIIGNIEDKKYSVRMVDGIKQIPVEVVKS